MIIIKIKAGLGNQLFQYATSRHLSLKENQELFFDLSYYDNPSKNEIFRLDRYKIELNRASDSMIDQAKRNTNFIFKNKILNKIRSKTLKVINEQILNKYYYGKLILSDSVYLDGWFANPKYFSEIRGIILSEFEPKSISNDTLSWSKRIEDSNSISIHLRRGDYIDNTYFHNLSEDYYLKSIDFINSRLSNPFYFVFSDDIEYARQIFRNTNNIYYMDINNTKQNYFSTYKDVDDLFLMTKCKHNIIANSTFSWWGAWLNQNSEKIVIAPKIWCDNRNAQIVYEKGEMIPSDWTKI